MLVVDEDIVTRAQVLAILSASGYEALSAPDGTVALAMSVRCRPDLVIAAVDMKLRGEHLTALLSVAFHDDAPPIVLLTNDPGWSVEGDGVRVLTKLIRSSAKNSSGGHCIVNVSIAVSIKHCLRSR